MVGMQLRLKDVLISVVCFAGFAALSLAVRQLSFDQLYIGYACVFIRGALLGGGFGAILRCPWRGALIGALTVAGLAFVEFFG
jgi:hypothetical protein